MRIDFARRLTERVEDAKTNGDPKCRECHGDGSVRVPGVGGRTCDCTWRIEEAYKLIGEHKWKGL